MGLLFLTSSSAVGNRGNHRKADREGERREQSLRHAFHEERRHENAKHAQHGDEEGAADLAG